MSPQLVKIIEMRFSSTSLAKLPPFLLRRLLQCSPTGSIKYKLEDLLKFIERIEEDKLRKELDARLLEVKFTHGKR